MNLENISQGEVLNVLEKVGKLHHYLAHKPTELWDKYDLSNYKSLIRKANKYKDAKKIIYDAN
ncbi:MAG: hypothetical protein ACJAVA_000263 [Flavobacteriaceae bacterium]|jgi:hypothetical protein